MRKLVALGLIPFTLLAVTDVFSCANGRAALRSAGVLFAGLAGGYRLLSRRHGAISQSAPGTAGYRLTQTPPNRNREPLDRCHRFSLPRQDNRATLAHFGDLL